MTPSILARAAAPQRLVNPSSQLRQIPRGDGWPRPEQTPVSAPPSDVLLTLRLGGAFAVFDRTGAPIDMSQKKGRLMLAMLVCAPDRRRSRDWLRRHLWHRSFVSHGFSSLRQCLHNVRRTLGPAGACLQADRDHIWLRQAAVDWAGSLRDPSLFLEDMPGLDGPSKDWRERMRAQIAGGGPAV